MTSLIAKLAGFRLQIAAALLLLLGASIIAHKLIETGVHQEQRAEARRIAVAQKQVASLEADLARKANAAGKAAQASQIQIQTRTRTIIERIPHEVPRASDVELSPGWLRLYNGSLGLPEAAGPSSGAHQPNPGLPSADALETIAGNNGTCQLWKDRAERLTAFYGEVRGGVNGASPRPASR